MNHKGIYKLITNVIFENITMTKPSLYNLFISTHVLDELRHKVCGCI